MNQIEHKIRVRYDEVDKMGYLYHGNYARYFHVGRTEFLRQLGISDKELEKQNIILPIIEMNIKYLKPVLYDELINLKIYLKEVSGVRIKFFYQIYNQNNTLSTEANMTLVFVNKHSRKPMRIPQNIYNILKSKIYRDEEKNKNRHYYLR